MDGAAQRLEGRVQAAGGVGAGLPPHSRLQLLPLLVRQQAVQGGHAVARQAVPGCGQQWVGAMRQQNVGRGAAACQAGTWKH